MTRVTPCKPPAVKGPGEVVRVHGSLTGVVWGTNPYSNESALGVAAVHAGLVAPGQWKHILVQDVSQQQRLKGGDAHGVQTLAWPHPCGCFLLTSAKDILENGRQTRPRTQAQTNVPQRNAKPSATGALSAKASAQTTAGRPAVASPARCLPHRRGHRLAAQEARARILQAATPVIARSVAHSASPKASAACKLPSKAKVAVNPKVVPVKAKPVPFQFKVKATPKATLKASPKAAPKSKSAALVPKQRKRPVPSPAPAPPPPPPKKKAKKVDWLAQQRENYLEFVRTSLASPPAWPWACRPDEEAEEASSEAQETDVSATDESDGEPDSEASFSRIVF